MNPQACRCRFETVSDPRADGVLTCAACKLPKLRSGMTGAANSIRAAKRAQPVDPSFASGARLGDTKELAHSLGVSTGHVWKLKEARIITPVNMGGPVRYHRPSVLAELKVKHELTTPPPVPIIQRSRAVRHKPGGQPRRRAA